MQSLEKMLIERECARLVHQFTHLVDSGRGERIAELFTPDGEFDIVEQQTVSWRGQDQIREEGRGVRERNLGLVMRHVCTNLVINVIDESEAEGLVYYTFYRG